MARWRYWPAMSSRRWRRSLNDDLIVRTSTPHQHDGQRENLESVRRNVFIAIEFWSDREREDLQKNRHEACRNKRRYEWPRYSSPEALALGVSERVAIYGYGLQHAGYAHWNRGEKQIQQQPLKSVSVEFEIYALLVIPGRNPSLDDAPRGGDCDGDEDGVNSPASRSSTFVTKPEPLTLRAPMR